MTPLPWPPQPISAKVVRSLAATAVLEPSAAAGMMSGATAATPFMNERRDILSDFFASMLYVPCLTIVVTLAVRRRAAIVPKEAKDRTRKR
jgi:hypothetical protein